MEHQTMYVLGTKFSLEENIFDMQKFLDGEEKIRFPVDIWINNGHRQYYGLRIFTLKELECFVRGLVYSKEWNKDVR